MKPLSILPATLLLAAMAIVAQAGDLGFSDPANVTPPPAHAIGFPSRDANLDALPGFLRPPPGYGEVAFYWWLGDPLTRERLAWQIHELDKAHGLMGLQINYAHGYRDGGLSFGRTYASDPPLFSESWWRLVGWFIDEARRHGMAVSLSDYTLGIGQGWSVDDVLEQHPELTGSVLQSHTRDVGPGAVEWVLPPATLMVAAYRLDGAAVVPGSAVDLRASVIHGVLKWRASGPRQRLLAVAAKRVEPSLDPLNPQSGPLYAQEFFGQFERRHPGQAGRGLNFFFSDELSFRVHGHLWTGRFAEEFRRRKGYDLVPELPALFIDVGPRTPKVRLDYSDVKVALTEEGFFKPVFDWHQQRGMIYGCDHGGRGRDATEFGDYFRTQRWNQGPGCDQPGLARDLIKNKVASSIAHLYLRPRVWLEGYHSSGWGTTSEGLTDATFANFAQGQNLLTLHGLYYSTHGGFWEWAPPCNHFRMPYWAHMHRYMACIQRLSYLLSQGFHRCDVAIVYPVAPLEAGLNGRESVDAAFAAGQKLYAQGIDFDFIDFESLDRAKVADRQLHVSGEAYRVLVLPAMRAARWSTLQKASAFQRRGGLVVVLGSPPEASDRAGRDDAQLYALVAQLAKRVARPDQIAPLVEQAGPRDFALLGQKPVAANFMHRKVGPRDVFMVHNAPRDAECWFRARGKVELWDPWTGATQPLAVLSQTAQGTRLRLPLDEHEAQLIVFSPGEPQLEAASRVAGVSTTIPLDGPWEFQLQPTLDNRFGDYRWPPSPTLLGAEARQFRYADETAAKPGWQSPGFDDSRWPKVTQAFGPKFWKLGPLPASAQLDARLARLNSVNPSQPVEIDGRAYRWQPYEFSWRWGVEGDPGPQGYHGLKERVSDDFIVLGTRKRLPSTGHFDYVAEPGGSRYYLWTAAVATTDARAVVRMGGRLPTASYLNGQPIGSSSQTVALRSGANPLLLRYDGVGRGHFVLERPIQAAVPEPGSLAMSWATRPGVVPYDTRPGEPNPAGCYRFTAPPGLHAMTIAVRGKLQAWVEGKEVAVKCEGATCRVELPQPVAAMAQVALRIQQPRGGYGGATLPEPIALECASGRMPLGDWSKMGVLECYSGGAWYRNTVTLRPEQARGRLLLDLGKVVASAEVRVNGQVAGIRVAPPWRVDVSKLVRPGENRIEVLVYNTLANHYLTIPTCYRGPLTSGLLGPVTIEVQE